MRHFASAVLVGLGLLWFAAPARAQYGTPILGGLIKIPGYSNPLPLPNLTSSIPSVPGNPEGTPSWFSSYQRPNFQAVPFERYNTYDAHYIPGIRHRWKNVRRDQNRDRVQ